LLSNHHVRFFLVIDNRLTFNISLEDFIKGRALRRWQGDGPLMAGRIFARVRVNAS
jgi:hypothetical protein